LKQEKQRRLLSLRLMRSIKNQRNRAYLESKQYGKISLKNKGWEDGQMTPTLIDIENIILNTKRYVVEHGKK
jgi:hypothetical protein